MSSRTGSRGEIVGRGFARNLDAGPLQPMIDSFELHLRAEKKSPKTIRPTMRPRSGSPLST